jgi:ATP-dependent Clp protease ATP-binding subunit ClpA
MTVFGRSTVRIVSGAGYFLLAATTFTLLLSDIPKFFWTGMFLLFFFADRALHWSEADAPLEEFPESGRVNLARFLRPSAYRAMEEAYDRSALLRRDMVMETVVRLTKVPEVEEALRRLDVNADELRQKAEEMAAGGDSTSAPDRAARMKVVGELVGAALDVALRNRERFIEAGDLFAACAVMNHEGAGRLFGAFMIDPGDLERALLFGITKRRTGIGRRKRSFGGWGSGKRTSHRIVNRAWTSRPTPMLDAHGDDLTDIARSGAIGFLVGHRAEYERLVDVLARPANPNALLVGEAGIGKETIIGHLAYAIARDEAPKELADRRVVKLRLSSLVAGAGEAELQARLVKIVDEITVSGNVVLWIPDIHNLVRTSGTAYLSAADALMPVIMNNAFPVIGTTYPREFKHDIESRTDFVGAFDVIRVEEISEQDAVELLVYRALELEGAYGMTVSFGAVKTAVKLAKKHFHEKFLPSSAEELLKETLIVAERHGEKFLGPDQVVKVAEQKVNVPIHEVKSAEADKLLHLEQGLHESVIGQDEAVKAVADAVREYRSGLSRPGGPIASFLFVGPTGVGKTQLAKSLAKVQFGSEAAMVRFDMTEYQDKASFYRLIGSPDGSVSGALTDAILHKPYSLVLLDEFEKAFPDILDLFLQVLDDGRLTDNLGRTVDFTNTIIIATSNAKSDLMNEALRKGQSMGEIADYVRSKLTDVYKPELLNRFSKIIVFRNLKLDELEAVVRLNLKTLTDTVAGQGIELDYAPEAVSLLAKLGYDPAFGARPIRRVIDDKVRAPLAELLLTKTIQRGGKARLVVKSENEFAFEPVS